jgi:hypothetical protein
MSFLFSLWAEYYRKVAEFRARYNAHEEFGESGLEFGEIGGLVLDLD